METEHFIIEAEHFKIETENVEIETEHFKMKTAHLKNEALRINLNAQSARSSRGSCETGKQATRGHSCTSSGEHKLTAEREEQQQQKRKAPAALGATAAQQAASAAGRPNQANAQTVWHECLPRVPRRWTECRQLAEREGRARAG